MEEKNNLEQEMDSAEGTQPEEVFEEAQENQAAEAGVEEENQAEARIAQLEAKLEEAENRFLRLQADFDNFRRRSRLDLESSAKYRAQSLISDLLPAIDNFDRALKMGADNEHAQSLLQGMEMVYRSLLDALKKEGAEPIEAVGKEFDPNLHQAVMQDNNENFGSNIVVEEFQKGYILKDRVIRPSMVKVNQ
ncbi:nucleotide exchange factor GrpE [Mesobacillus foraminis]|uniref:nucleotide exchange factor GrpE n=1 Tax=Mesobacillus foraminis TaxID=279826 RepID=UPI001BE915A4|nr:nucleotide exchange factor GrpE [Mesobacillus foraminis]MBT2754670.1 nucleotide exchange factor GrpE [Mesobacillus foraminis]